MIQFRKNRIKWSNLYFSCKKSLCFVFHICILAFLFASIIQYSIPDIKSNIFFVLEFELHVNKF